MEQVNQLMGGEFFDCHPTKQPENTTRGVTNMMISSDKGDMFSLSNENGLSRFDITDPNFPNRVLKPVGSAIVDNTVLLIMFDEANSTHIFAKYENNVFTKVGPVNSTGQPVSTTKLYSSPNYNKFDCVARKLINGDRVLYFTNGKKPVGYFNYDKPALESTLDETNSLIPTMTLPDIEINQVKEGLGSLYCTTYFFITRYITSSGGYTTFGFPSSGVPIFPASISEVNNVVGSDYNDEDGNPIMVSKNIGLKFTNVDVNYNQIQIIACWYDATGTLVSKKADDLIITSDTMYYTFVGVTTETIELSLEELRKVVPSYNVAKAIEQKDNILFLSNLSGIQEDQNDLQAFANSFQVNYNIEEIPFCNRNLSTNELVNKPYYLKSMYRSDPFNINIQMNSNISTAGENTILIVQQRYTHATATITVNDYLALVGKTITIDTVVYTEGVDFNASVSNDVTAASIALAVNSSSSTTNFYSKLSLNVVTVFSGTLSFNGKVLTTNSTLAVTLTNFSGEVDNGSNFSVFYLPTISGSNLSFSTSDFILTTGINFFGNYDTEGTTIGFSSFAENGTDYYSTGSTIDGTVVLVPLNDRTEDDDTTYDNSIPIDYINPITCANKKGYMRGEVYSFGVMFVYKDGSKSMVYHIPSNSNSSEANTTTKKLGKYTSQLDYPTNQNYPSGKITHHVMPRVDQEPLYEKTLSGQILIRVLGVSFNTTLPVPTSIINDVREVVFVRELRNDITKKSILSQGFLYPSVASTSQFGSRGVNQLNNGKNSTGNNGIVNSDVGYHVQSVPMLGLLKNLNCSFSYSPDEFFSNETASLDAGFAYPTFPRAGGSYDTFDKLNTDFYNDQVSFFSPETQLTSQFLIPKGYTGKFVARQQINIKANVFSQEVEEYRRVVNYNALYRYRYSYQSKYGNINVVFDSNDTPQTGSNLSYTIQKSLYTEDGSTSDTETLFVNKPSSNSKWGIHTKWSCGTFVASLDSNIVTLSSLTLPLMNIAKGHYGIRFDNQEQVYGNTAFSAGNVLLNIYNYEQENLSQYGSIGIGEYVHIKRVKNFTGQSGIVFGGDIFITKYAFNMGNLLYKFGIKAKQSQLYIGLPPVQIPDPFVGTYTSNAPSYVRDDQSYNMTTSHGGNVSNTTTHPSGQPSGNSFELAGHANGFMIKEFVYYFVESQINTYLRHQDKKEVTNVGKLFLPYENNPGSLVNRWPTYRGNVKNYNGVYSYEGNILSFIPRGSTQELVSKYPNRTIWSDISQTDSIVDNYRSFSVENYYDLPSHTGEIWDSFVFQNTLYLHTPKCLWRTFAEPTAQLQAANISDVVLGTGTLFVRPSTPVVTSSGGYGGTKSQFAGVLTTFGYVFPDILQGKIFLLAEGLEEISAVGMMNYFSEFMINIKNESDNPFLTGGLIGYYDHKYKRYHFISNYDNKNLNYSFSFLTKKWISSHTFWPKLSISMDDQVYSFGDNTVYVHNEGDKGVYDVDNLLYSSNITVIANGASSEGLVKGAKTFNNLSIKGYVTNKNRTIRYPNFFRYLQVRNISSNSGRRLLVTDARPISEDVEYRYVNSEYRIAIPRNTGTLTSADDEFYYAGRIKGEYAEITLEWNNKVPTDMYNESLDTQVNYDLVLNEITTIFDTNIR